MADNFADPDREGLAQDLLAERYLLGTLMLERAAIEATQATVSGHDFSSEQHRLVYEAIVAVADQREPVDLITVQAELKRQGVYERVGGLASLMALFDDLPVAGKSSEYAEMVRLCSLWRGQSHPGA